MLVLLIKSIILVVTAILYRSALPRYRIDQLLTSNWKIIIYYLITFLIFSFLLFQFFLYNVSSNKL